MEGGELQPAPGPDRAELGDAWLLIELDRLAWSLPDDYLRRTLEGLVDAWDELPASWREAVRDWWWREHPARPPAVIGLTNACN